MGDMCAHSLRHKIFLFDIGNVLMRWSPRNLYVRRFDSADEMQRFFDTCCTQSWHEAHDRGVPMAQNAKPLIKQFPHWADHIRAWKDEWNQMFDGAMPGAVELLADLAAQGVPLYALTNMPAEVMPGLRRMFPHLSHFTDIIVSGEEGVLKPDPKIFEIAAKRLKAAPKDIFFIDDSAANVAAARMMGFDAVVFTNMDALRETIKRGGLAL